MLSHSVEDELGEEDIKRLEVAKKLYDKISSIIMETELKRGDTETEFSKVIYSLKRIYGSEYFVRILSALGQEALERSMWFNRGYYSRGSVSKRQSMSHLLQACIPSENDSVEKLKEFISKTDISEQRLIEAAMYSPEWLEMVGEYLGWNGFTSGCYYFIAHMNEDFDSKRKAMIAKYTPLEVEQLRDGAFDLNWFFEVYEQLGDKRFKSIYQAAKYISDGSKHTRARKYADAALGKYVAADVEKDIEAKRNKDLLMAYSLIPLEGEEDMTKRYLFLQKFLKESKKFGAQRKASEGRAVQISMENLSINAGYQDVTRLTLKMESKIVEDMKSLFEPKEVEAVRVWLNVNEEGMAEIICEKADKQLKSVPAKLKKNEYILTLVENKKILTEQYRRGKKMLEDAMENETKFAFSEIVSMLDNPVLSSIIDKLVLCNGERSGFAQKEGLKKPDGKVVKLQEEAEVIVAHPYHLYKSGDWQEYQKYLFENQIRQPFKQIFRELYVKTEEEMNMYHSMRYSGNQIQPGKTLGCLKQRGWVADVENGLQKIYYKENIVAQIYAIADWFSPADIEAPTLEWVVFSDRKTFNELKVSDIPEVIFSEVMRDVDMAVSVAHSGSVDPETSHSTIEMRRAIAEFTMPLFKLKNVTFSKTHAIITGQKADYTVHLGSGVVHQQNGTMLQVLPVHSQRRGRLFLPFLDEDPKTAEILSKIILFAQDEKIKDPFILQQIR